VQLRQQACSHKVHVFVILYDCAQASSLACAHCGVHSRPYCIRTLKGDLFGKYTTCMFRECQVSMRLHGAALQGL